MSPTANTPNPSEPEFQPPAPPAHPLDLKGIRMHSIHDRRHIAEVDAFADAPGPGVSFAEWFDSLPAFLGAERVRAVAGAIVDARRGHHPVAFAMGAHVVKVGCGPVIIDLMRRGLITAIACNGATAIHDMEIAMIGATSEDVGANLRDGRFGMVRETAEFFAEAAGLAAATGSGFGAAIGHLIRRSKMPHAHLSILASAAELEIPATVHVAIGTDTVHMTGLVDGAAIGAASMTDFRIICDVVAGMSAGASGLGRSVSMGQAGAGQAVEGHAGVARRKPAMKAKDVRTTEASASEPVCGASCGKSTNINEPRRPATGVWCNIGSAVIMPEVFLKAVSVARNLGADLDAIVTANLDQLRHYRPAQNVVSRPVAPGRGYDLAGHHEIMLPLLRQAVVELWG
jgi:hypothetical protein